MQVKKIPFAILSSDYVKFKNFGLMVDIKLPGTKKEERNTRNKPLATSGYHHYKEDHPSLHLTSEAFKDETAKLARGITLTNRRKHYENRFYNVESIDTCVQSNQQIESTNKTEISTKNLQNVFETNRAENKNKSAINTQNLKHVFGTNQDLMKTKDVTSTEQHHSTMIISDDRIESSESISYDINDNFENASTVEFDVSLPSSKDDEIQLFDTGEHVKSREGMNLQLPVTANNPEFDDGITQEFKSVMKEKARKMISDENGLEKFNQIVQKAARCLILRSKEKL